MKKTKKSKIELEELEYFTWDIENSRINKNDIKGYTISVDEKEYFPIVYLSNILLGNIKSDKYIKCKFDRNIRNSILYMQEYAQDRNKKYIVYVHNLNYEIEFLLKEFKLTSNNVIALDNKFLQVEFLELENLIFRDSVALFNLSIEKLGKMYNYPKLKYDYEKIRLPWSDLEELDFQYNKRDNEIIIKSLYYYCIQWNVNSLKDIKITSSSQAKYEYINSLDYKKRKTIEKDNKKRIYNNMKYYNIFENSYQGGFSGGRNIDYFKVFKNVYAIDVCSLYPSMMIRENHPIFELNTPTCKKLEGIESIEFFNKYLKNKRVKDLDISCNRNKVRGYIGIFHFKEIEVKSENHFKFLSDAHCRKFENLILYEKYKLTPTVEKANGKVIKARDIIIYCDDFFYNVILDNYKFEKVNCIKLIVTSKRNYLRKEFVQHLLNHFKEKEKYSIIKDILKEHLKTIEDKKEKEEIKDFINNVIEVFRNKEKLIINSAYGKMVQKKFRDDMKIINSEKISSEIELLSDEEKEDIFNENNKEDVFNYDEGCFTSSKGRLYLSSGVNLVLKNGGIPILSDTDSIKFIQEDNNISYIEKFNKEVIKENKKLASVKSFLNSFSINDFILEVKDIIKDFKISDDIIKKHTKNIKEEIVKFGTWSIELDKDDNGKFTPIELFSQGGAKKYISYHKGEYKTTISGVNKNLGKVLKNRELYLKNKGFNINPIDIIEEIFNTGIFFPYSITKKLVPYDDKTYENITSCLYENKKIHQRGGVLLEKQGYLLNISLDDNTLDGYLRNFNYRCSEIEKILLPTGELLDKQYFSIDNNTITCKNKFHQLLLTYDWDYSITVNDNLNKVKRLL